MVIIGRGVKGISVGIFSSILSVYVGEIFPVHRKGLATSMMQWSLTWGILLMFYTCFICNFMKNDLSFRIAWGMELLPGISLFILSFFLPESPRWLASRSKWQKASLIMKKLNHPEEAIEQLSESQIVEPSTDRNSTELTDVEKNDDELKNIEKVLANFEANSKKCSYKLLFQPPLSKHLLIGIGTQFFTQMSGISVLMYYIVYICEMSGLQGDVKVLSASIPYFLNVMFTIFPILWIDSLRRKDILVFSTALLGTCITVIGIVMGVFGHSVPPMRGNESIVWEIDGWASPFTLALCFLFVAIFSSSLSCAAWLYTNEIFPQRAKAKGSSICMGVSFLINCGLTFLAPLSFKWLKFGTFLIFGGFSLCGSFLIGFTFPETLGCNDEIIENFFKDNSIEGNEDKLKPPEPILQRNEEGDNDDDDNNINDVNNIDNDNEGPLRYQNSERTKLSIPTHLNNYHHTIIDNHSGSPSSNNSNNGHSLIQSHESEGIVPNNVSPFLKKIGGPFETESHLSILEQDVEGVDNDVSTTYTDGLISSYYKHADNSLFFKESNKGSPFK